MARDKETSRALPPENQPSHALSRLDRKDKGIIYELEQNSRRSLGEIAKKLRLSKQTLHYRIQRLVTAGVVGAFITAIDSSSLGYVNHEVWIQLNEINLERKKAFLDFLIAHPNTRWVASCGGKFDLVVAILAENLVQFNSIFKAILRKFPGYVKNHYISISSELYNYPRTHLVTNDAGGGRGTDKERKAAILGGEQKKIELDEADLAILGMLSKNARIETIKIAQKVGIAPNTVRTKIRRLEKEGVIQGYTVLTQPSKMDLQNYEILVNTQNLTEEKEKELESFCLFKDNVTFLLKVVGKWDLDIAFDAWSSTEFQKFLTGFRSRFADIIKEFEYVPILYVHKFDYFPMRKG